MPGGKRLSAALVTPLSGPLARYGRSGATALRLWAAEAGVDLAIADAYPSAAAAVASVGARHRIDVLFGPYGAGPAVAAARAAPTVLWNHGGASARLVRQAFPHVVNIPAPAGTYLAAVIGALDAAELAGAEAVLLHSRTGFGREVADGALGAASPSAWRPAPSPSTRARAMALRGWLKAGAPMCSSSRGASMTS